MPGIRVSIFAKVVVIMLVLAVSLMLMVALFFGMIVHPPIGASADRMLEEYARLVAAGSPDLEAAKRSRVAARPSDPVRGARREPGPRTTACPPSTRSEGDRRPSPTRSLGTQPSSRERAGRGHLPLLVGVRPQDSRSPTTSCSCTCCCSMVAACFVAHVVLRRALRPLRALHEGVARLSEGDLDVVLENRSRDEFGALTDAFNQMVRRVKGMIEARDQLLLDVSHELRSPLTRMKVALALMPDGEKKARMDADVAEMEAMLAELLELERLRDGRGIKTQRQDLVLVLREAAEAVGDGRPGSASPARSPRSCWRSTGTGSAPFSGTSWRTRSSTPFPTAGRSRFWPPGKTGRSRSASRTTVRAFPRPIWDISSSRSSGWTGPAPRRPAATAWA